MTKIKQKILPPSSASFHHFESTALDYMRKIEESNSNLRNEIQDLRSMIAILQKQVNLYSEVLLKNGSNESSFDTRVKLFQKLPPATGQLRYCQRVTSKLMKSLDEILRDNGIEYWFGYGSLLGAYTRNAPIPWDDDVDICMHRDGLKKLLDILSKSDKYQITVIYDWYAKCIQYRFCSKDVNLPSFIDIGVWDYATEYTEEKDERLRQMRQEMMLELDNANLSYWEERKFLFDLKSGYIVTAVQLVHPKNQDKKIAKKEIDKINEILERYIEVAYKEKLFCDKKNAKSYAYSFDNLYMPNRRMLYEKDMIHPTVRVAYEDFQVCCPKKIVPFLNTCYSNWPYIPNDTSIINGGHIDNTIIDSQDVRESMEYFLSS